MKTVEIGDRLDPYTVPESRPSIGDRLLPYEVRAVVDSTDGVIPIVWIEEMGAAG